MFDLTGKTAFMTAAGAGIGRATALALAEAGATVHATDIDENQLASLGDLSDRIVPDRLDATDKAAIDAAAKRLGAVDILFNCAGYVHHGTVLDVDDDVWTFSFDLNVRAQFRTIRAFLPAMLENGGGAIINTASVASSIKGAPNRCVYGATKAAVIGLTKAVAADFTDRGVRCNAICPGTVDTPSLGERMRAQGDVETARTAFMARQPIGRFCTPEEVAALVVYLASDEAAYVTGQTHVIDGAWSN